MEYFRPFIIFLVLFFCYSCNSNEYLERNGINELKYLIDFMNIDGSKNSHINGKSFNWLFKSLSVFRTNDSCNVFICNYYENNFSSLNFLICFNIDSLQIFRQEKELNFSPQSIFDHDSIVIEENYRLDSLKKILSIENDNIFISKVFWGISWADKSIWRSKDKRHIYYYRYENCRAVMFDFKYEKTIKNRVVNPNFLVINE
jgi:hypothetical protein